MHPFDCTIAAAPQSEGDGSFADRYSWANRTLKECLAAAQAIEREAYAAGVRAQRERDERIVMLHVGTRQELADAIAKDET